MTADGVQRKVGTNQPHLKLEEEFCGPHVSTLNRFCIIHLF